MLFRPTNLWERLQPRRFVGKARRG